MSKTRRITPDGSNAVCPYLMVDSVEDQIKFLVNTLGAVVSNETKGNDGFIRHGEVRILDSTVMMGRASKEYPARTSMNYIYVENTIEVHRRALQYGAVELMAPDDRPYGVRESGVADPFGNQWWFAQLLQ